MERNEKGGEEMIEKILQRFSYVRKIEEGNKVLNARIGSLLAVEEEQGNLIVRYMEELEKLQKENDKYKTLIAFLVNETHLVMEDTIGQKYVPIKAATLEKYQGDVVATIKETAPAKGYMLYARVKK